MARFFLLVSLLSSISLIFAGWYFINGFDFMKKAWWIYLKDNLLINQSLPQYYNEVLFGAVGFQLLALFIFAITQNGAKSKTLSGGRDSKDLHGSARFAMIEELKKSDLLANLNEGGVIIGGAKLGTFSKIRPLIHHGPEHILGFAPTRSGKGVGLVIPTLLTWQESVLCLDIKGENFAFTAGYRESLGHRILKFAPTIDGESHHFNPLTEIEIGTRNAIKQCQNAALILIDPDGKGLQDHWQKSGNGWLSAIILHVLYKTWLEEKRCANFRDIGSFCAAVDLTASQEEVIDQLSNTARKMVDYNHQDPEVDAAVLLGVGMMLQKAPQEYSGVHSTASLPLLIFADPILSENTSKSDFSLKELTNGEMPTALYIIIPPSEILRMKPIIRIMVSTFISKFTESMEYKDGKQVEHFKHKLLLMLDEFTSIGKMDNLETALGYMASYGLKAYLICQDNEQLTKTYGQNNSIMSNCHVRIAYAPNKEETAQKLEKMLGITTIVQRKTSVSRQEKGSSSSENIVEVKRPLLTADECMTLPKAKKNRKGKITKAGEMLTIITGERPIKGKQYLFFQQPELLKRTQIPAPDFNRDPVISHHQIDKKKMEETDITASFVSYADMKNSLAKQSSDHLEKSNISTGD